MNCFNYLDIRLLDILNNPNLVFTCNGDKKEIEVLEYGN